MYETKPVQGKNAPIFELDRLYTTQLTVVIQQLVTSATCFGLVWPSLGLQRFVSIKVHNFYLGSYVRQVTWPEL